MDKANIELKIKKWLTLRQQEKKVTCPFGHIVFYPCKICCLLFPEIKSKLRPGKIQGCPCSILGIERVINRAENYLKECQDHRKSKNLEV